MREDRTWIAPVMFFGVCVALIGAVFWELRNNTIPVTAQATALATWLILAVTVLGFTVMIYVIGQTRGRSLAGQPETFASEVQELSERYQDLRKVLGVLAETQAEARHIFLDETTELNSDTLKEAAEFLRQKRTVIERTTLNSRHPDLMNTIGKSIHRDYKQVSAYLRFEFSKKLADPPEGNRPVLQENELKKVMAPISSAEKALHQLTKRLLKQKDQRLKEMFPEG